VRRTGGSVGLVRRFKLFSKLEEHNGCVNALHFNDSGTLLASGSDDLNVVVWRWAESKAFFKFDSGHRSNVFQCKFMPFTGDCHLVSCAREGHVRLAELSSTGMCKRTKKLAQHRGAAHKLALLCDSSHVFYSCGEDAVTFQIDLRQDKPNKLCTTKENNHPVELYSIHANPFKSFEFCVAGRDHFVRIYDVRKIGEGESNGVVHKYCPEHLMGSELKANITCAVYNHDGTEVLASYNDEDIYLFDCTKPEPITTAFLHRYTGHRNNATVKGVNFYGPKSEYVVSGSDCGHVFLWDRQSEAIVNYFHADEGGVINVLEPHPSLPVLATSGLDHDVKIWMPLSEEPTKLEGLDKVATKNRKERETESNTDPDIDSHILWMLMQHLRRSRRRYMRNLARDADGPPDDDDSASSSSDPMSDDDDDDGDRDENAGGVNTDGTNADGSHHDRHRHHHSDDAAEDDDDDENADTLPVATVRCNPS
jgi:WD repeat-containing protein 42A